MNKHILLPEIQQFIKANLSSDLHGLLLKKSPFAEVTMQEIVQQIKGLRVAEKKFPSLIKENILFPPSLNLEQTSSEITAQYKAQWLKGKSMIDLTSGFGIDAYFISQNFEEVTLVEQNTELMELVAHNWKILKKKATFVNENLTNFLAKNQHTFDLIYLDPARRDLQKRKVFLLEDLSPNLIEIQQLLLNIGKKIVVKLSPLIDLYYLINTLPYLSEIHIVAWKNEVKEIIVVLEKSEKEELASQNPKIISVNLESGEPILNALWSEIQNAEGEYSIVKKYLYLPNTALLKAQALPFLGKKLGLKKLHPNTQLLTSDEKRNDFPGRILRVNTLKSQELKKNDKYNIISKNHPLTPEQIKKKYKLQDGGEKYLIFTQCIEGKLILVSE